MKLLFALLLLVCVVAIPAVANAQYVVGPEPQVYAPQGYVYGMRRRPRAVVVAYEGGPIPPGARLATRPSLALVIAGSASLGVGYVTAFFNWTAGGLSCLATAWGSGTCRTPGPLVVIPILGPWLDIAITPQLPGHVAASIASGVFQAAGLAMLIGGLAAQNRVLIYEPQYARDRDRPARLRATIGVTPVTAPSFSGLALAGTF